MQLSPDLFFMLGHRLPEPPGGDNAERRAAAMRDAGCADAPVITADAQFRFEVAVRDGEYDAAMQMLEAEPELLKHMTLSGQILRWPIVAHPPFQVKYPTETTPLVRLQAERRQLMAQMGISDGAFTR